jgi:hypothetical protein
MNVDSLTIGLVAFISGIGTECAKEVFITIRKYREKMIDRTKPGNK